MRSLWRECKGNVQKAKRCEAQPLYGWPARSILLPPENADQYHGHGLQNANGGEQQYDGRDPRIFLHESDPRSGIPPDERGDFKAGERQKSGENVEWAFEMDREVARYTYL
jgi:hypothetical protein